MAEFMWCPDVVTVITLSLMIKRLRRMIIRMHNGKYLINVFMPTLNDVIQDCKTVKLYISSSLFDICSCGGGYKNGI